MPAARRSPTFSVRRYRRARRVAHRALCAALVVALRAPCVAPDAVQRARIAVPDAAPYQTSPYRSVASWARWASCWFGLQPVTPAELQARPPVQTQPRIQKAQECFYD